jgi:hypothetical protein
MVYLKLLLQTVKCTLTATRNILYTQKQLKLDQQIFVEYVGVTKVEMKGSLKKYLLFKNIFFSDDKNLKLK